MPKSDQVTSNLLASYIMQTENDRNLGLVWGQIQKGASVLLRDRGTKQIPLIIAILHHKEVVLEKFVDWGVMKKEDVVQYLAYPNEELKGILCSLFKKELEAPTYYPRFPSKYEKAFRVLKIVVEAGLNLRKCTGCNDLRDFVLLNKHLEWAEFLFANGVDWRQDRWGGSDRLDDDGYNLEFQKCATARRAYEKKIGLDKTSVVERTEGSEPKIGFIKGLLEKGKERTVGYLEKKFYTKVHEQHSITQPPQPYSDSSEVEGNFRESIVISDEQDAALASNVRMHPQQTAFRSPPPPYYGQHKVFRNHMRPYGVQPEDNQGYIHDQTGLLPTRSGQVQPNMWPLPQPFVLQPGEEQQFVNLYTNTELAPVFPPSTVQHGFPPVPVAYDDFPVVPLEEGFDPYGPSPLTVPSAPLPGLESQKLISLAQAEEQVRQAQEQALLEANRQHHSGQYWGAQMNAHFNTMKQHADAFNTGHAMSNGGNKPSPHIRYSADITAEKKNRSAVGVSQNV